MTPEDRLQNLGITLPQTPRPLANYVPAVRTGNLVYLSGMLPFNDGKLLHTGKVGATVTLEQAQGDARLVAINALAALKGFIGELSKVTRTVHVAGYVASTPEFIDQPKVINGVSDLLVEVLGEAGVHSRAAVGVASLPLDAPLEVTFIFEVRD